jgi:hypothetical protein
VFKDEAKRAYQMYCKKKKNTDMDFW